MRESGRIRLAGLLGAAALVCLTPLVRSRGSHVRAAQGATEDAARMALADSTGIPADHLSLAAATPLGDTGGQEFKMLGPGEEIYRVALDYGGRPLRQEEYEDTVRRMDNRGFVGKLESELADRVSREAGPIDVIIWVKGKAPLARAAGGPQREANLAQLRAQTAALQAPVVHALRRSDTKVLYEAAYAPVVAAAASPAVIQELTARADVERVYVSRTHQPRLGVSRKVVRAHTVNARGFSGQGGRIGVVEAGRIGTHTNLPAVQRVLCRASASSAVSGHKTNVAGVIQSTHGTNRGMAPSVTVIDGIAANFTDPELMAATDCVIANGADAINMSFGWETNGFFDAFARYVDATVYMTGRSIVVAVSNVCANRMGSPEIAFNALAVGSFSDRNTVSFGDDVPSCSTALSAADRHSAFLDPFSTGDDREEPDLVAPGHLINMPNASGAFSVSSGTSFAAPHVTGGLGLLVQRTPFLESAAETLRAAMMASARHNIEGATRLSEQDGVGAILLDGGDSILASSTTPLPWGYLTRPGGTTGFPIEVTFRVAKARKVRMVTTWAHKSPLGDTLTRPTTDLDLRVFTPGGALMGSSLSFDNNYEVVEFTAPATGIYRARIDNLRDSPGPEFIGYAVSR